MVCLRRARTFIFVGLTLIILTYIAYNIYLIIVIFIERKEICEKLRSMYKNCDFLKIDRTKRARFQELLREWTKIAERNNISYVLSSGSLLGQYRNGDVIAWDIDVDVILDDTLFSKLEDIVTPRNFTQGADSAFHFVVQPEYTTPWKMRRWNCNGQVRSKSSWRLM